MNLADINIDRLSLGEQLELLNMLDELEARTKNESCRNSLHTFAMSIQEGYKMGPHLQRLYELLSSVEKGEKDRIVVNMAPRFGKSNAISIIFPAWYLGRNPAHKLIIASHTADLAVDMLRKVRNVMQTSEYKAIFPDVAIATDAKAAGKWNTNHGGEAYAVGVGGALAGRGANLLIVDDPFSEQDIINGNYEVFDKVYEWYAYGARTRLMPNGKVAILHCLVGDTRVTLADGSEILMKNIRPGASVLSYKDGNLLPAKVVNWVNQGSDNVFTVALKSGNIIRGNERHPFLVRANGVEQWVKIKDLKRGMLLVATSSSKTETVLTYCRKPSPTLSIILDEILSITPDGQEDVFDITVEGTENFLANGVVSHNTRWSQRDLTAKLLKDAAINPEADQFELFEFPAILNENEEDKKSLWPDHWTIESLLKTKASMPLFQWNAQYQQNPTSAEDALIPKTWFKTWEPLRPPTCEFIIMALDAAVESNKRSDYNALTTWGAFLNEDTGRYEIILLNSQNFRAEFPELKDITYAAYKEWGPDSFIIEAKANGAPLLQEFNRMGVYAQPYVPHRGTGDKRARLGTVADMIRDGLVWVPTTRWAEELVEQVGAFPGGENDDLCDSMYLALMRFRQGGFVALSSDKEDDDSHSDLGYRERYY